MFPVAAIPTTCGTGSEVTGVSVLTRLDLKTKKSSVHKLYPAVAFVDGKYLKTAPSSIICNTAMDSLAHMIEGLVHKKATDYTRMCASSGLELWRSVKDVISGDRQATDEDLQNLMDASTMAGMTIAQTGTTIPHALSYPITIGLNIPHGKSVSYFQAEFLKAMDKADRDWILGKAGLKEPDELDELFKKACNPEEIPLKYREIAYEELCSNKAKLSSVPFKIDDNVLRKIAGI
jgi:alcohol dehydrogenase